MAKKICSLCDAKRNKKGACTNVECKDPLFDKNLEASAKAASITVSASAEGNGDQTFTIVAPRNPAADDQVLISFGDTNQLCEVEHPWLQLHHVSPDGYVAVVVKEYPGKIYPHKSKGEGAPYWEWPA